ncbi:MAG TPA: hypothetical protein DDW42_02785, partial [Desulfobacteraceae bacterium]|nr:hypothetical protein [Desulfobacteraceae bacterium]
PGTVLREKYEAFKSLLRHDKRAHELMAELDEIYYNRIKVDIKLIEQKTEQFSSNVSDMVENLGRICPSRYLGLKDYLKKFDFYIRFMLAPPEFTFSPPFVIPIDEVASHGPSLSGGKAYNLGLINKDLKLPMPEGFVITTNAFYYFMEFNDLWASINDILSRLDVQSTTSLDVDSKQLVDMVINARIPPDIEDAILRAYDRSFGSHGEVARIAMRSSAVSEDSQSSFAGQYRTVLDVTREGIMDAYKSVIASKYEPKALYYRINYGLSDLETPMAVLALEMIDPVASGVAYTKDLDNAESNTIAIHSIWGLGELLVSGKASPDMVKVTKERPPRIVEKKAGNKPAQMVFSQKHITETVGVDVDKRDVFSIGDPHALTLGKWGIRIEAYFKEPQDIEWCLDHNERLFLLQSRPLRVEVAKADLPECNTKDITNKVALSGGEKACSGIGAGKVFNTEQDPNLDRVSDGCVLVAKNMSTRYVKIIDKLSAVVTDTGSKAGHFSSVAREFGVPAIVNTGIATNTLHHGREITVYADKHIIYEGLVQAILDSPCAKRDLISDSPYMRKMRYIINFISPLRLVDPEASNFAPEGVRSLHDIIRFTHEKALQEMFHMGEKRVRKIGGSKKLVSEIPMIFYVLDVGGGLKEENEQDKTVKIDEVISIPMRQVFKGLSHPDIRWGNFTHFNWEEYDRIVMSGGIISAESAMLASYAVVSNDYMNLNLRFGYHFVILDTICGNDSKENYIFFRFSGGGADMEKRSLRAEFLYGILIRLGFEVDKKADLIDAQIKGEQRDEMENKLDLIGRLLGATRLMDMYLRDSTMVALYVDEFMKGRYHFSTVED